MTVELLITIVAISLGGLVAFGLAIWLLNFTRGLLAEIDRANRLKREALIDMWADHRREVNEIDRAVSSDIIEAARLRAADGVMGGGHQEWVLDEKCKDGVPRRVA